MEGVNYEEIIRGLSEAYAKKQRVGHDQRLEELRFRLGESVYSILKGVVILGYLEKERVFGAFPEETIKGLASKCSQIKETDITPR